MGLLDHIFQVHGRPPVEEVLLGIQIRILIGDLEKPAYVWDFPESGYVFVGKNS
jgi:hypothetical protein